MLFYGKVNANTAKSHPSDAARQDSEPQRVAEFAEDRTFLNLDSGEPWSYYLCLHGIFVQRGNQPGLKLNGRSGE